MNDLVEIGGVTFKVLSRTVRCDATKFDARSSTGKEDYDVPALLETYFPQHGPYLGIYAQVVREGELSAGDHIVFRGAAKRASPRPQHLRLVLSVTCAALLALSLMKH